MGTPGASSELLAPPGARAPDFFIVGSPKSGTTALYEMLRRHPQIYMPRLKEPRFLASDMSPRPRLAGHPRERGYPRTLEDYLALFAAATPQQRAGEASTFYLWSHTAAEHIARLRPDARIVAILREPASFLRSLHLMFLRWGVETEKDLRKAIALEDARREGRHIPRHSHRPQLLRYSEQVRYVEQLRRYDAHFPRERMLVLIYEDFLRENEATVRKVLRFLGVDEQTSIETASVNVTTRTIRSQRARSLLASVSQGRGPFGQATKTGLKTLTPRRLRRGAARTLRERVVSADAPAPDESTLSELRQRFQPQVAALGEYLDRDLIGLWGYEPTPTPSGRRDAWPA